MSELPELPELPDTTSIYAPVWQQIKNAGIEGVQINLNFSVQAKRVGRELTKVEKDRLFTRVRKAISHRKGIDHQYTVDNPYAKIQVVHKDYETGAIIIALRHDPDVSSLANLSLPTTFKL